MDQTITTKEYGSMEAAFSWFNRQLFEGKLSNLLITYNRHPKSKGYYSPARFEARTGKRKVAELAMNPDTYIGRSDEGILSTLVHEMCHHWQYELGKPPRAGYHDRQWADKMESLGLVPSSTGEAGGKRTGQKVTHYVQDSGLYQVAYQELQKTGFILTWQSPQEAKNGQPRKSKGKKKFTCPVCGLNVWAKDDAKITCGECYAVDEETVRYLIPEGGFDAPKPKVMVAGVEGWDGFLGAKYGKDDDDKDEDDADKDDGWTLYPAGTDIDITVEGDDL